MHWLALHFPALPLEVYSRACPDNGPMAVVVRRRKRRILLCNAAAEARGVVPGQSVAAALALVQGLQLLPHQPASIQAALEQAAFWAGRFSSHVSLTPPAGLLLEAGRSLSLFGGAEGLVQSVRQELVGLGYQARWCLAPTPEAALVLAGLGGGEILADSVTARSVLSRVPLAALALQRQARENLEAMGLRTLGELLRLPRAGLAQRFGAEFVAYLARLLGEMPDPRPAHVPPAHFDGRLALPAPVEDARALLFAARRLVLELCGFLLGRGGGVQRLEWTWVHGPQHHSRLVLGLARPSREPERLLEVLRERLERVELPEPVRELRLQARDVQALHPRSLDLFPRSGRTSPETSARLLERLRARLGQDAVKGLGLVADHRPERAWCYREPGWKSDLPGRGGRPLWLLSEPRPLQHRDGWPWLEGRRLQLDGERERIESGWWDGGDVARDYFIARTPGGERLWVFRELRGTGRWFLHGWFL